VENQRDESRQKWRFDGDKIINSESEEAIQILESKQDVILWYPSPQPSQLWTHNLRSSPTSTPRSTPDEWVTIESKHSGFLLDIEGARGQPGTKVIVWPANGGDNQKWKFKKGFIKSKLNKKLVLCFDVRKK
jgi:hypothetical protein